MNFTLNYYIIIFLSIILIVAAVIDVRVKKIPNVITFPTIFAMMVYHILTNGWQGLFFSFGGMALGIAIFFVPYLMGGMGAGDVKLMGAVGATIGPKGVFFASLSTAIAGGLYALIILLINRKYAKDFISRNGTTLKTLAFTGQFIPIAADKSEKKLKLCYGIAIAIGTFSYIMLEFYGINTFYI